jgi:hypothetical protein
LMFTNLETIYDALITFTKRCGGSVVILDLEGKRSSRRIWQTIQTMVLIPTCCALGEDCGE